MQAVLLKRIALALVAFPVVCAAANPHAVVTLLEGEVALLRGAARYALAEGVGLQSGDIIEVAENSLAQIEYPDGAALALGAGTRLLTVAASAGKAARGEYYVIEGALKLTGVKQGDRFRFATPIFIAQPREGALVLQVRGNEGAAFAETGETRLMAGSTTLRLKSGDFCTRRNGQKPVVAALPSKDFVAALPKLFLDPLPSRMALYQDRSVEPRRLQDVSYAAVEAWLKAPPAIRRPLVARFEPRTSDAAFRAGLVANLKFHPEWGPVLYPVAKEVPGDAGPISADFDRRDPAELKTMPAP